MTALLVVLAIGFAYSMGAHYTGACMGMPCAQQRDDSASRRSGRARCRGRRRVRCGSARNR